VNSSPNYHHPRDPEKNYVEAGQQQAGRVVAREVGRVVGPSERGHRPQAGTEPGVEHVVVLHDVGAVAFGASRRAFGGDDQMVAADASDRRESDDPTKAGARYTSRGYFRAS